jgi:hypothetical protein
MSLHTSTRTPVDDKYAALVGKAVYVFAYYEWAIIWIINCLQDGFVCKYCREVQMTSGKVKATFKALIDNPSTSFSKVGKLELEEIVSEFESNIVKRNALIHAHPVTESDGSQILAYQTIPSKPLPDMKWPSSDVEKIISEFDKAVVKAGKALDKLRS